MNRQAVGRCHHRDDLRCDLRDQREAVPRTHPQSVIAFHRLHRRHIGPKCHQRTVLRVGLARNMANRHTQAILGRPTAKLRTSRPINPATGVTRWVRRRITTTVPLVVSFIVPTHRRKSTGHQWKNPARGKANRRTQTKTLPKKTAGLIASPSMNGESRAPRMSLRTLRWKIGNKNFSTEIPMALTRQLVTRTLRFKHNLRLMLI